jgi:DNA-binding NtrC family response regulator
VGGVKPIPVDVRIVATTNKDLEKAVREGNFREDLYYRLNVVPVRLPALRERKSDIPLLLDHFLEKFAKENNKKIIGYDYDVYDKLKQYDWPGNVRELENAVERAVVLSQGELLLSEHFDYGVSNQSRSMGASVPGIDFLDEETITLEELERRYILRSLDKNNWNKTQTAKLLDVSVRTLRNKLDIYRKTDMINI